MKQCKSVKLVAWIESSDGEYDRQDAMRVNKLRFTYFRYCRRIDVDASYFGGKLNESLICPALHSMVTTTGPKRVSVSI